MTISKNIKCILALVFLVLLPGCHKEKTYKIGVSQCSEDDWRLYMNEEIERELMFHPEATVEIRSAFDDNNRQIEDIKYFIDNNFDIIIAAPNEAEPLTPIIREAYEKKIPVLLFDRNIIGDTYTSFQGADNAAIGRKAAEYIIKKTNGSKVSVIELQGRQGSTPAVERARGFKEALATVPDIRIVASENGDWNYEDAVRLTDSLLNIYPNIDVIYAHNDRMALGAADVSGKRGLDPLIIGIDAAPEIGLKAVAQNKIDVTFLYPTEGYRIIRTALDILKGKQVEKNVLIPPPSSPVDTSNVDLLLKKNEQLQEETQKLKLLKTEVDDYWNEHTSQTSLLYALLAILILVCLLLFFVLRTYWQHKRHQRALLEKNHQLEEQHTLQRELNSRLAAATQSKLAFFTNVSHDLRTPLTLIAEPVDQVKNSDSLSDKEKSLMRIADKNIKILKRLINQILDFRKFENDKLKAVYEEVSPAQIFPEWAEAFRAHARKNYIDFTVEINLPEGFTMALDVEKTERVVFNLLYNAFKFTPRKGRILLKVDLKDDNLRVEVADSGKGIPKEDLENIFARFYQAEQVRPQGSGIGLSLAKAFVELQNGSIEVESEVDKGSRFTVLIPVTHTERKYNPDETHLNTTRPSEMVDFLEIPEEENTPSEEISDDRPLLLIIDDNEDIRLMVKELLKDEYEIISASDGREGIKTATKYVPDLIICDVMMPGMDGIECCGILKNEISTSHIPLLMLTACSMDEQRVEGYESGADGYMSKPFSGKVLKARIKSLLSNRKKIKEMYQLSTPSTALASDKDDKEKQSAGKDVEKEFYARFLEIVMKEMGDSELSVDTLAAKMGLGRSQFYRKIKSLTNFSPVELLRHIRLKKARELLLQTNKTISEIAYEVGFSTPAYFTKCYREVYSETPSELREKIKG